MHQAPIFRPFDVHLAVSDLLRLTPITLSVCMSSLSCYDIHVLDAYFSYDLESHFYGHFNQDSQFCQEKQKIAL